MAPEVILKKDYGMEVDVWSLGITAIEMAEYDPPYMEFSTTKVSKKDKGRDGEFDSVLVCFQALFMISTKGVPGLKEKNKWSGEFWNFVSCCTAYDPKLRPQTIELLQVIPPL
jgi:serine/threonine protein kinase